MAKNEGYQSWRIDTSRNAPDGAPMIVAGEHGDVGKRRLSTYREIAQVRLYHGSEDMSLAWANARLIAQAPAMLEAIERFVARVEAGEIHSIRTYHEFKGIIAKIREGEGEAFRHAHTKNCS